MLQRRADPLRVGHVHLAAFGPYVVFLVIHSPRIIPSLSYIGRELRVLRKDLHTGIVFSSKTATNTLYLCKKAVYQLCQKSGFDIEVLKNRKY